MSFVIFDSVFTFSKGDFLSTKSSIILLCYYRRLSDREQTLPHTKIHHYPPPSRYIAYSPLSLRILMFFSFNTTCSFFLRFSQKQLVIIRRSCVIFGTYISVPGGIDYFFSHADHKRADNFSFIFPSFPSIFSPIEMKYFEALSQILKTRNTSISILGLGILKQNFGAAPHNTIIPLQFALFLLI